MIRIFINFHPWSLSNKLCAYAIDENDLFSVRLMISKTEAEYSKLGGVLVLYSHKLRAYRDHHPDEFINEFGNDKYEYIGCLGEINEELNCYVFTARFKKWGSPPLVALPLPSKEKLQELGLIEADDNG